MLLHKKHGPPEPLPRVTREATQPAPPKPLPLASHLAAGRGPPSCSSSSSLPIFPDLGPLVLFAGGILSIQIYIDREVVVSGRRDAEAGTPVWHTLAVRAQRLLRLQIRPELVTIPHGAIGSDEEEHEATGFLLLLPAVASRDGDDVARSTECQGDKSGHEVRPPSAKKASPSHWIPVRSGL